MEGLFQITLVPQFTYPQAFELAKPTDPYTPLMRAYPGEAIEIRTLVGAHMAPHSFNMHGVKWLFEQDNPNSGFRSTQGMGISEYYQMRFEVPTTNSGADYLYASTSDTLGLEYGQWGLLRAYSTPQTDLPPLVTIPAKPREVCTASAPAKSTYKVSVVAATQLPEGVVAATQPLGGALVYNSRGTNDGVASSIVGRQALLYVFDEDFDDLTSKPMKLKPTARRRIEPIMLRAAAGDCIEVTLTNRLSGVVPGARPGSGGYPNQSIFNSVRLFTSLRVGLHAQQVGMDILAGNGVNIGENPDRTIKAGQDPITFKWYAGSIAPDGSHTPVELGAIGLSPADPLMQHPFGMLGALIVEPAGATWRLDDNSRASAMITMPSGESFREFILVLQDDVQGLTPISASGKPPDKDPGFTHAINYRTEPLAYRYNIPPTATTLPPPPLGIARALSDSQVNADPQTPVLAVSKGTPTRLRVVHPGGLNEQTFTLSGHSWQEEPFRNNSREIGGNGTGGEQSVQYYDCLSRRPKSGDWRLSLSLIHWQ
jgi:hypothetical protein